MCLLTAAGLRRVAEYADGLGAHYSQLLSFVGGRPPASSALVAQARAAGLQLHAYTFRRDDLPPYAADLEALLRLLLGEIAVDGVFADHPDVAVLVRDALAAERAN